MNAPIRDIDYSDRCKELMRQGISWPKQCDNKCKALTYWEPRDNKHHNAERSKKDSLHDKTCNVLRNAYKICLSFKWYPNKSFINEANRLIDAIEEAFEKGTWDTRKIRHLSLMLDQALRRQAEICQSVNDKWTLEKKERAQSKDGFVQ